MKNKIIIAVSFLLFFIVGCASSAHGITIDKPSRRGWSGGYERLFVDGVSVLISETSGGQVYVVIRGDIENTRPNKTFIDLSVGAELRATDGSLGGENHLRGPNEQKRSIDSMWG